MKLFTELIDDIFLSFYDPRRSYVEVVQRMSNVHSLKNFVNLALLNDFIDGNPSHKYCQYR